MYPYSYSARRSTRTTSLLPGGLSLDGGLPSIPSDIQVDRGASSHYEYSSAPPFTSNSHYDHVDRTVPNASYPFGGHQVDPRFAQQLPWNTYNTMLHPADIARQRAYYSSLPSNIVSSEGCTLPRPVFTDHIPDDISMGV